MEVSSKTIILDSVVLSECDQKCGYVFNFVANDLVLYSIDYKSLDMIADFASCLSTVDFLFTS